LKPEKFGTELIILLLQIAMHYYGGTILSHICHISLCVWPCKVTIRPGFSGTVLIFNDVSRNKNHSSTGTPICPVFGLVSRICPDLHISATVCLRIGGQKLVHILSVYKKKSLAAGAPPRTPLMGELTTLPQTPKSGPRRLALVAFASYTIRTFGARPGLRRPIIMITLAYMSWLLLTIMTCTLRLLLTVMFSTMA